MKKKYKCARCGRTTFSKLQDVKCPRKDPQCIGVMLLTDGNQTTIEKYQIKKIRIDFDHCYWQNGIYCLKFKANIASDDCMIKCEQWRSRP